MSRVDHTSSERSKDECFAKQHFEAGTKLRAELEYDQGMREERSTGFSR